MSGRGQPENARWPLRYGPSGATVGNSPERPYSSALSVRGG
jgi:hypothetical protein